MIITADIGGTKTLVAAANNSGQIVNEVKFLTPKNYKEFIGTLSSTINNITSHTPRILSIAIPGTIDRGTGIVKKLGNLPWKDVPLIDDLSEATGIKNIIFENDANLAGLSEAHSLDNLKQKVMYVTFSTGIGTGFIVNGVLDPELLDSEGGHMVFEHDGKMMDWESFAAGRVIVEKYGKRASELEDTRAWKEIAKDMAIGILNNCAIFMPNTVIIGGGVGTHFKKYSKYLRAEINRLIPISEMIPKPTIVGAKHAEEAVILGCLVLAKQHEQRK